MFPVEVPPTSKEEPEFIVKEVPLFTKLFVTDKDLPASKITTPPAATVNDKRVAFSEICNVPFAPILTALLAKDPSNIRVPVFKLVAPE